MLLPLLILPPLLYLLRAVYRNLTSPLRRVPGPFYTSVTSLVLIYHEFAYNRRDYIHSLHVKYGPVVRISSNEVSFTSLGAIKEIYSSGGSGYDKTEFYTLFMQFGTRTAFSTLGKADHSYKRRYIASQYANSNIMRPETLDGIQDRANAFVKRCTESHGTSLDAYVYLHCFAIDCASRHLFHPYGLHSIEGGEDFDVMHEQTYHESLKSNLMQYYWPALSDLILKITKPRASPLSNKYVLDTVKKEEPSPHSLLSKLQEPKSGFGMIEIAAECMDHLLAGIDTTGDGLCFILYTLSLPNNRPIQLDLQQELLHNQDTQTDSLPYLEAVIKEGLRVFPPIPMSAPRYVPAGGRTIDGYFVPEGTIVGCQAWSMHRLNEDVFDGGDEFRPERWLCKDEGRILEMNRMFFAFGVGGRGCIGRHLAMAEMKCLLRAVYSKFTTRIADDMHGRMELSDQIISSRPLDQTCKLEFELLGGK